MIGSVYTKEQKAEIRDLWESGFPVLEIMKRTGRTKGGICGIINRMKLHKRNYAQIKSARPYKGIVVPRNYKPRKPKEDDVVKAKKAVEKPIKTAEELRQEAVEHDTISLLERTECQCAFIVGEPRNGRCCGKPVASGSYCQDHWKATHQDRPLQSPVKICSHPAFQSAGEPFAVLPEPVRMPVSEIRENSYGLAGIR